MNIYILVFQGSRYWRNRVARVAKKFIGEISFSIADKKEYSRAMDDWSFKDKDAVNVVARNEKGQIFRMTEKFAVDSLESFVNEFKDGKIKPYIKSEPVPEDNDGPVKVKQKKLIKMIFG